MTIRRTEISKILILGIGFGSILYRNGTLSDLFRRLQLLVQGSPNSVDRAEVKDVDSTNDQLLVNGPLKFVDQTEGEDADSTDAQVFGVLSTVAMRNLQQKVKILLQDSSSETQIKWILEHFMHGKYVLLEKKGQIQKTERKLRAGRGRSRAVDEDADSTDAQDIPSQTRWIHENSIHAIDVLSEIKKKIKKTERRIRANGGQSSY